MAAASDLSDFEKDPRLFLFTSLTAGSSHIITATSRLETILKANKIPFQAIDTATNEKARKLWQRRASKKKLPGLVKDGFVIGDLEEIEEWNEFGELKENIGPVPENNAAATSNVQGVSIRPAEPSAKPAAASGNVKASQPSVNKAPPPLLDESKMRPLPGAAEFAARNKLNPTSNPAEDPPAPETMSSPTADKEESVKVAKEIPKNHPSIDHLSAPASRIHSGIATPQPEPDVTPAEGVGGDAAEKHHRGNEIKEAPDEDVKKVEDAIALHEEAGEEEDENTAKAVEGLKVDEDKKPQGEDTKDVEEAGKSVEV